MYGGSYYGDEAPESITYVPAVEQIAGVGVPGIYATLTIFSIGLEDIVANSTQPDPSVILPDLAAGGRNPADITLPTQGTGAADTAPGQGSHETPAPDVSPLLSKIEKTLGINASINTNKTMNYRASRRGQPDWTKYVTQSTTLVTDSFIGDQNRVSINFNTKTMTSAGLAGPEKMLYQSPSWTIAQKQMIERSVRAAIQKIERALVILSDPQALNTFLQSNPVGNTANMLRDRKFVTRMLQFMVNVKQGLQNGTINLVIDPTYKDKDSERTLNTQMTSPGGWAGRLLGPYYKDFEPIKSL